MILPVYVPWYTLIYVVIPMVPGDTGGRLANAGARRPAPTTQHTTRAVEQEAMAATKSGLSDKYCIVLYLLYTGHPNGTYMYVQLQRHSNQRI